MNEPAPLAQAGARAGKADPGLWHRAPAWRNLTVAASLLTLAAVAVPALLPASPEPGAAPQGMASPVAQAQATAPDRPAGAIGVSPGVLVKLNRHNRFNQGQDWPISITILSPPAHGTISIQDGTAPITYHDGVMRMSAVKDVFYKADPGYTGPDTFTYKRVSQDEADPLNARTYTMTVYVK
jgi:hypothetical protein